VLIAKGTPKLLFILPCLSVISAVAGLLLKELMMVLFIVSVVLFVLFIPLILFFRDPTRIIGKGMVSPADGRVMFIDHKENKGLWHIAIFMNVHNVHVNRAPLSGIVKSVSHMDGPFFAAFKSESHLNERVETVLRTNIGEVIIIQIAGAVARRIVPYIKGGESLEKGDKIGMIRFGSRVDVIFSDKGGEPSVSPGMKVRAGLHKIASIREK